MFVEFKRNFWKKKKEIITTKEQGDLLEKRVEILFKNLGKWNVKRNVLLKDIYGFFFL